MSANRYNELTHHVNHDIKCVKNCEVSIALECNTCGEVLVNCYSDDNDFIVAYFDGYGKSNDRDYCMFEFVVRHGESDVVRFTDKVCYNATSQVAEYEGALGVVKWCNTAYPKIKKILRGDSKLVINQQGSWKTREPHLIPLRDELKKLLSEDGKWTLEWVESKRNYADLRKFRRF